MVLVDLSPLKYRNFRFLYIGQLVSMLGSQMTMIAIPFQVYAITKSTFQTGLVSAIELICLVITALWGGVIADMLDRRKIIIFAEIAMMVLVIIMAVNAYIPPSSLELIYVLAGIISGLNGFHRPAFEAITPQLIPKSELSKVSSLVAFKYITASLVGPTIAGYLIATAGPMITYLIDGLSFAISLGCLLCIGGENFISSPLGVKQQSFLKDIAEGASYIYSRKDILASYLIDFFAMVFCMPQVLFPALSQYHGLNNWLGTLYMSIACGGFIATLISRWTYSVKRLGIAISLAALGWAFSILISGIVASFWGLLVGLFFAGICDSYSGIFRMTMWNESIAENYRGRIASFSMLSYTSGPLLGNTVMGFLGDQIGLHKALALGGTISILLIGSALLFLPAFFKYRSN